MHLRWEEIGFIESPYSNNTNEAPAVRPIAAPDSYLAIGAASDGLRLPGLRRGFDELGLSWCCYCYQSGLVHCVEGKHTAGFPLAVPAVASVHVDGPEGNCVTYLATGATALKGTFRGGNWHWRAGVLN
jgi:hypothetical protein